ncbi:hypothetical protein BC940DRAFT_245818 [Gongronella butleri]|nr:hypothetical protein BC940DRAFT_245818 [Gongronella butleri]
MGAQVDATVTTILGLICAVVWALAALAATVAYNSGHLATYYNDAASKVINGVFLVVGIFCAQLLRQVLPKFFFFSLQFMIVQIFSMTRGVFETQMNWKLPLNFAIPLSIGAGLSLVINIVAWPESAVDGLGRALQETIKASQTMLQSMTEQFFLDPESDALSEEKVDEAAGKMRFGMTKVKSAYREAKYELSYAYIRPQEVGDIRKTLDRLTKHLGILGGCLKSERELFASALEALEHELNETDDELKKKKPCQQQQRPPMKHHLSALDADLLRAALRATNDVTIHGNHSNDGGSRTNSQPGSRNASRPTSRATSRRGSIDSDHDYTEENQKSVSSLKSMFLPKLTMSRPSSCPPPRPTTKKVNYSDRHLLMIYLESLRDPLMELALHCRTSLNCANKSISAELDIDDEDDSSIRSTWVTYLRHVLKLKKKVDATNKKADDNDNDEEKTTPDHPICHPEQHECHCVDTMSAAIRQFDISERKCMDKLYRFKEEQAKNGGVIDLGLREELFLVFFFMFTLREVANELEILASELDTLREHAAKRMVNGKRRKHLYMPRMTQKWWRKWAQWSNHQAVRDKGGRSFVNLKTHMPDEYQTPDAEEEYRLSKLQTTATLRRERSKSNAAAMPLLSPISSLQSQLEPWPTNMTCDLARMPTTATTTPTSPGLGPSTDVEKRAQDKKPKAPLSLRFRYGLWRSLQWTKSYDFRFSLKMAVAVLVLCMPAFFPSSAYWYTSVKGQWSAMTVIAVLNPTSGGTLAASGWRVVGTLIGAFMGWGALEAAGGSPYVLAAFAVILAVPFFYIHLASTYTKVGVVTLIAYMVVALSQYAYPVPGETVAATVWLVWPFVARHGVRKTIPSVLDQLADYYTFLMGTFLYHLPTTPPSDEDITLSLKMESNIQKSIESVLTLLELTDNEPRLRGPFPKAFYKAMIDTMQDILDRLASMRVALFKMSPPVKKLVCHHEYYKYRRDMIASILLHFFTLSSALRSKSPMPIFLPSARAARTNLLRNQQVNSSKERLVNFRNLTWFAVACCTEEIISELEHLSTLVKYVVGDAKFAAQARRIDAIQAFPQA